MKNEKAPTKDATNAVRLVGEFKTALLATPEFAHAVSERWMEASSYSNSEIKARELDGPVEFTIGSNKFRYTPWGRGIFSESIHFSLEMTSPEGLSEEVILIPNPNSDIRTVIYIKKATPTNEKEDLADDDAVEKVEKVLNKLKQRP